MKIFKFSLREFWDALWARPQIGSRITAVDPIPPPPPPTPPQPSCLAKGIAKLWRDNNRMGWVFKRSKPMTITDYRSGHTGTFTNTYTYRSVTLTHNGAAIEISLQEMCTYIGISNIMVKVGGKFKAGFRGWSEDLDRDLIEQAIKDKPYPALKKRMDKEARDKAHAEESVKFLENLGCPK